MIYWVVAPHNKNFYDNSVRTKFNNCLDSVIKLFPGQMRVVEIKEIWEFKNNHLVAR